MGYLIGLICPGKLTQISPSPHLIFGPFYNHSEITELQPATEQCGKSNEPGSIESNEAP